MTSFDRIETRMPQLMDELAPARVPDYFDDMLRQSARTRQRPAWSSLERWLPMGVIARAAPMRQVPWRPLVIAVILIVLAAAAVALYAGSRYRVPPPFGPARNGVVATSINGDIATVDVLTGATKVIIGGPTIDTEPVFTRLGDRLFFARATSGSATALYTANADGSGAHEVVGADKAIKSLDWTPSGDRLIYTSDAGGGSTTAIVDTTTGASKMVDLGMTVDDATWRPGHDEFVFNSADTGTLGYYLATGDGSSARPIASPPGASEQWSLSQDGSKLVYYEWDDAFQGRLHTIDIDTGADLPLTQALDGYEWENAQFSPDGTQVLAERYVATDTGQYHLALIPVGGNGPVIETGPAHDTRTNGAQMQFSPDGKSILAMYQQDGSSWLLDAAGGPGRRLEWSYAGGPAWQRLAP
jgi:Tol biopolymer transport system component